MQPKVKVAETGRLDLAEKLSLLDCSLFSTNKLMLPIYKLAHKILGYFHLSQMHVKNNQSQFLKETNVGISSLRETSVNYM